MLGEDIVSKLFEKFKINNLILKNRCVMSAAADNLETDLLGLCRPLIRESNLINRWQSGDHKKATCISHVINALLNCLCKENRWNAIWISNRGK